MMPLRIQNVKRTVGRWGDRARRGLLYVCENSTGEISISWDDTVNTSKFEFRLRPDQEEQLRVWLVERHQERVARSVSARIRGDGVPDNAKGRQTTATMMQSASTATSPATTHQVR